jgi:hypothetical protein
MAIRSSAGSGVVISLIVFVLLTILLLAGSILLWGQLETTRKAARDADQLLAEYAPEADRNSDWLQPLKDGSGRDSIVRFLYNQNQELRQFAIGSPDGTLGDLTTARERLSLEQGQSLADGLADAKRTISELTAKVAAMTASTLATETLLQNLDEKLQAAFADRDALIAADSAQLAGYTNADDEYAAAVKDAIADFEAMQNNLRDQKDLTIRQQQDHVDELTADNKRLAGQKKMLEKRLNRDQLRAADPATLVDGRILDVVGSGDHVYIDRGRNDQIVLGMTFEVYDSPSQIRPDDTGEVPRGKASIQVVKIGDASSTAKVTRRVSGRPLIANNIIANAVYDPEYTFKFLVHGIFDLDQDGNATEQEAEYLRERIERWGGEVVKGNEIPGDLDFLVLGVEPITPVKPLNQGSTAAMNEYRRLRTLVARYQSLLDDAQQAEIPVLNQNRLNILTGRSDL